MFRIDATSIPQIKKNIISCYFEEGLQNKFQNNLIIFFMFISNTFKKML